MITFEDAWRIFKQQLSGREVSEETLQVRDADGRVLAEELRSRFDAPAFDRAAMDGYAVMTGDDRDEYAILGVAPAGMMSEVALQLGGCVKVMTGAPVPAATGKVIPVENVVADERIIRLAKPYGRINISRRGEDLSAGSVIARQGQVLDPAAVGLLISCGIETVRVKRRVKAVIFSTGNELVMSMADWRPGKIFDINGPLLRNLLTAVHVEAAAAEWLPDGIEPSLPRMEAALASADLIFITGGVSAGDYDYIPEILRRCGAVIHFSRVRIKPGKPMTFATTPRAVVLGIPGNPVSAFVMYHLFGIPALRALQGNDCSPRFIALPMREAYQRKSGERMEFIPARLDDRGRIRPTPYHGSGHFAGLAGIDGFLIVDADVTQIAAEQPAPFWLLGLGGYRSGSLISA